MNLDRVPLAVYLAALITSKVIMVICECSVVLENIVRPPPVQLSGLAVRVRSALLFAMPRAHVLPCQRLLVHACGRFWFFVVFCLVGAVVVSHTLSCRLLLSHRPLFGLCGFCNTYLHLTAPVPG